MKITMLYHKLGETVRIVSERETPTNSSALKTAIQEVVEKSKILVQQIQSGKIDY